MSVPRRWLLHLLDESFAAPAPPLPSWPFSPSSLPSKTFGSPTRARRLALAMSAARGLPFGAPLLRPGQHIARDVDELVPIVRTLAVVADVVAVAADVLQPGSPSPAPASGARRAALSAALAVVYGEDSSEVLGGRISGSIVGRSSGDVVDEARLLASAVTSDMALSQKAERALLSVERSIGRRRYLTGNPIVGLTLHHALTAIDARALVLVAVDVLAGAVPDPDMIERVQRKLAKERLAAAAAIAGLSEWRELIDVDAVREASLWQVKSLGLGKEATARLVEVVKRPPDLSRLLTLIPVEARARVFLHTALAAVVDGRVSPEERGYLKALGDLVGLSPAAQKRGRRRVLDFVKRHAREFDPLAAAAGFAAVDPPLSVRLGRTVFDNADALWREIRKTGDLGVLLARRTAGQPLSADEQRRMRDQLVDVVKAVPSLAVFALPGGFVLLPLLLKLLPFDLRPSSFRDLDDFHAFARDDKDTLSQKDQSAREQKALSPPRFFRR